MNAECRMKESTDSAFCILHSSFPLQRSLNRLPNIRLQPVADFDVVVVGDLDAALEARLDLLGVFLHAAERFDREVLGNHLALADQPQLAAALNVPVGDEAAGDVAELGDLEDLPHLGMAVELLAN